MKQQNYLKKGKQNLVRLLRRPSKAGLPRNDIWKVWGLFFGLVLYFGCAAPQVPPPDWVGAIGKSFTEDGIEGIGFGTYKRGDKNSMRIARDNTYNDALQKMVLRLKITVKGSIKSYLTARKEFVSGDEKAEEVLESTTQAIFDTVLGRKQFEEYNDRKKGEYWVLVWMTQEEVERAAREALLEQEKENRLKMQSAVDIYQAAEAALLNGEILSAMPQYDKSAGILKEIVRPTEMGGYNSRALAAEIGNKANQVLTSIKIKKFGDGQSCIVGQGLGHALKLAISYRYKGKSLPAKNLPLQFSFVQGQGEVDNFARTDVKGMAAVVVHKVAAINPTNIVEAKFDTEKLTEVSPTFSLLAERQERFTFSSKSPREMNRVLVKIEEENLGQPQVPSVLETEITKYLIKQGYRIVNPKKLGLAGKPINVSTVKGKVEILITGKASTQFLGGKINLPGGEVIDFGPSCRAEVSVKAVDVNSGKVMASKTESGIKGFGRAKEEAGQKALQKAAESIAKYLASQLLPE